MYIINKKKRLNKSIRLFSVFVYILLKYKIDFKNYINYYIMINKIILQNIYIL